MSRLLFIGFMIAALVLWIQSAQSQPADVECLTNPDRIEIEDHGPDEAVVTYYNSVNQCSDNEAEHRTIAAPNGVEVHIVLVMLWESDDERVEVQPLDPAYEAIPPYVDAPDGATRMIHVRLRKRELF